MGHIRGETLYLNVYKERHNKKTYLDLGLRSVAPTVEVVLWDLVFHG